MRLRLFIMLLVLAKLNLISVLSMIFSYIVVNRASFDPNNHGSISSITITLLLVNCSLTLFIIVVFPQPHSPTNAIVNALSEQYE